MRLIKKYTNFMVLFIFFLEYQVKLGDNGGEWRLTKKRTERDIKCK